MAKALELTLDSMTPPPVPKAAQVTTPVEEPIIVKPAVAKRSREVKAEKIEAKEPLQVRWSGADVKAVKLAALQMDYPTVSDFMLACFHAFMKDKQRA